MLKGVRGGNVEAKTYKDLTVKEVEVLRETKCQFPLVYRHVVSMCHGLLRGKTIVKSTSTAVAV
jgi:hypothetical protein